MRASVQLLAPPLLLLALLLLMLGVLVVQALAALRHLHAYSLRALVEAGRQAGLRAKSF